MRSYRELVGSVLLMCSSKGGALTLASVFAVLPAAIAGQAAAQGTFTVTSSDLHDGAAIGKAQVYDHGECKGGNVSPQLSWRNPPAGTKSFAVTIFDIDAPGPGWWHWAVAGIPPNVTALPANASGSGYLGTIGARQARNDWGDVGYGGPCPPPGKPHRYIVTVFALNTVDLRLAQGRHALMFDHEINTALLAKASLTVTYQR